MKRKMTVVETLTYYIEFDAPDGAGDETVEEIAYEEWGANHGRSPDDYDCDIAVHPVEEE